MLITLNNNFLRSGFSLPSSAVDGKSKFAASVWVYWVNRTTSDNNQLIGELVGATTTSWTFIRNSTGRIQCTVAVDNGGAVQRVTVNTNDKGSTGGSWYHLYFTYEASTGLFMVYVNGSGTAENTTDAGATGRNLWTTSADRPVVAFFNNADEWKMGETVVWMGASIPALADIQGYYGETVDMDTICAGVAPVIRYENIKSPTETVDGAAEFVEDSSGNGYNLVWTSGSATIDDVPAGSTAVTEPYAAEITTSGELIKVSFRNIVGGDTSIIVDRGAGAVSLRRKAGGIGAWSDPENSTYYSRRGVAGSNSNVLWLVIPSGLRATSASDLYEITFADRAAVIYGGTTQWSGAAVLTPTNGYGVEQHPLPEIATRKPLNSSLGAFSVSDGFLRFVDVLWDGGAWSRVATYGSNGIPATIVGGQTFAFASIFGNFVPAYSGTVHLLWRGLPASVPKLTNGSSVELSLAQSQDTIDKNSQTWNRRTYAVVGTGCILAIYPDGSDQFNLTDIAVVRDEQITRWQAGNIADSGWAANHGWFTSLRWMDAMHAVNCNAWDEAHFLSESYGFPRLQQDNTSTESTVIHTVTAQETYTGDGYFNSGTILKLTLSGDHTQLKTGQRCTLSNFTPSGGSPSTVTVSIDTDNAGLAANEVAVRASSAGTHSGSGTLTVALDYIPPVWSIAGLHNAAYAAASTSNACWICRPHACTDAAWEQFVGDLDTALSSGIEIWVEYSNETWNSAFEGQWRHMEGLARRNSAANGHDQYAASSYATYKTTKAAATSGRVVRLIVAGQSVTSSVLDSRMGYLQTRYTADSDPEKPATWSAFPVVMSTSNYFDWLNSSGGLTVSTHQCNRDAVVNLTSDGVIDLGDLAYRDMSSYLAIKTTYGKDLWAYEGGPAWDVPNEGEDDFTAVTRAIFAAAHHPRMANIMWGAWETYVTDGGFDGVSSGSHEADWSEITGKNWSNIKSWNQVAGKGDGTDSLYDNVSNLATYISNGDTDPVWDNLVSTRAYAVEQWAAADVPPQYLFLSIAGQYLVLEMAGG